MGHAHFVTNKQTAEKKAHDIRHKDVGLVYKSILQRANEGPLLQQRPLNYSAQRARDGKLFHHAT